MATADQHFTTDPSLPPIDPRVLANCMEACAACELSCSACADACLAEPELDELRRCLLLNLDCADICHATARLLARALGADRRLLRAQLEACARACATCGAECAEHESMHEHCRACALSCRACATSIGRVLRELPDSYGLTHPPAPVLGTPGL